MCAKKNGLMVVALVLGVGVLLTAKYGRAAGDEKTIRTTVLDIAAALDKKDVETAKKKSADLAAKKVDLEDVMALFKRRAAGGFGVGEKPGNEDLDGIELRLKELEKNGDIAKEAPDIAQLGLRAAAIAHVAEAMVPEKKEGNKDPKDWKQWSADLREDSLKLSKLAVADKVDPAEVKKAAAKITRDCKKCHDVFRDAD
jgi:hypothetical protein